MSMPARESVNQSHKDREKILAYLTMNNGKYSTLRDLWYQCDENGIHPQRVANALEYLELHWMICKRGVRQYRVLGNSPMISIKSSQLIHYKHIEKKYYELLEELEKFAKPKLPSERLLSLITDSVSEIPN